MIFEASQKESAVSLANSKRDNTLLHLYNTFVFINFSVDQYTRLQHKIGSALYYRQMYLKNRGRNRITPTKQQHTLLKKTAADLEYSGLSKASEAETLVIMDNGSLPASVAFFI